MVQENLINEVTHGNGDFLTTGSKAVLLRCRTFGLQVRKRSRQNLGSGSAVTETNLPAVRLWCRNTSALYCHLVVCTCTASGGRGNNLN